MRNLKMTIAYDGTDFLGWQKTKMGSSIEEELEKAASRILRSPAEFQAASRTDAGVHAQAQVVNFFSDSLIPFSRLQKSLNSLLPLGISVLSIEEAAPQFHPTLHCSGKEYHYSVCFSPSQLPFHRRFSWHFPYPLDIAQMQAAAPFLIGTHDFSAFANELKNDNVRQIDAITIDPLPNDRLVIRILGKSFLYKMARNIAGTLLYVGCGKIKKDDLPSILKSCDRKLAGVTAPAHGLSLQQVFYAP